MRFSKTVPALRAKAAGNSNSEQRPAAPPAPAPAPPQPLEQHQHVAGHPTGTHSGPPSPGGPLASRHHGPPRHASTASSARRRTTARIVEQAPAVAAAEIVRRFWPFARPYRRWIALGLGLLLIVPAIDTLEIYLFKLVVDDVLVPRELSALFPIAAAYLGLALLGALASFGDEYVATWVGERFLLDLRAELYAPRPDAQRRPARPPPRRRPAGAADRRRPGDRALPAVGAGEGISAVFRIVLFTGALVLLVVEAGARGARRGRRCSTSRRAASGGWSSTRRARSGAAAGR